MRLQPDQYASLLFPLNVYAALLHLDQGRVDALHFGIFRSAEDTLSRAQQRATELVFSCLPEPGARVLDVGCGLGSTLARLLADGYDARGLNPDEPQVTLARRRYTFGADRLLCLGLEELDTPSGLVDAVLFQESAQYIDMLVLLQRSADLLTTGGRLVVMDEFVTCCSERRPGHLHQLEPFLAQAGRCGFTLVRREDLGLQAAPTLDYLLDKIRELRAELLAALSLDPHRLDALLTELERYRDQYRAGCYGYALLCLEKTDSPPWSVTPGRDSDRKEVLALFQQVFSTRLEEEDYQRKYRQGRTVVVRHRGRLVGHYGGVERDILFMGRPDRAVQIGDVMVAPAYRRRKGPFWLSARAFAGAYVGNCGRYILAYGFPNVRAMRVGKLLGLYSRVGTMVELELPAAPWRPAALLTSLRSIGLEDFTPLLPGLNRLWQRMAADFGDCIIGVRDGAYLRRRYLEYPGRSYQLFIIRRRPDRRLLGVLVFVARDDDLLLVDWVAPLSSLKLVLAQAARVAAAQGKKHVSLWLTDYFAGYLADCPALVGAVTREPDISIPMISCVDGPAPEEVKDRWWLTAGDADFI